MEDLTVRDALETFEEVFPDLDLADFLQTCLNEPVDETLDYIITNYKTFKLKTKQIVSGCESSQQDMDLDCDDALEFDHSLQNLATEFELFTCLVCYRDFSKPCGFECTENDENIPSDEGPDISNKTVSKQIEKEESIKEKVRKVHTFCLDCIRGQAEASLTDIHVSKDAQGIQCMAVDCNNPIRFHSIAPYLSRHVRIRLAQRLDNQALANVQDQLGLEHCKRCVFAMEMRDVPVEENKVFRCLRCHYEYCRKCGMDWTKHFGKSCFEASSKRHEFESKLNEAVVRTCPRCRLQFIKSRDCNNMTCRCGLTMCYLCRKTGITDEHFCRHVPKVPGEKCTIPGCSGCNQGAGFKKMDQQAIEQVKQKYLGGLDAPGTSDGNGSTVAEEIDIGINNFKEPDVEGKGKLHGRLTAVESSDEEDEEYDDEDGSIDSMDDEDEDEDIDEIIVEDTTVTIEEFEEHNSGNTEDDSEDDYNEGMMEVDEEDNDNETSSEDEAENDSIFDTEEFLESDEIEINDEYDDI